MILKKLYHVLEKKLPAIWITFLNESRTDFIPGKGNYSSVFEKRMVLDCIESRLTELSKWNIHGWRNSYWPNTLFKIYKQSYIRLS